MTGADNRTILFATFGSLGDLHPLLHVALEMKARGFTPVFAVPPEFAPKIERAGLEARIVFPSNAEIGAMIGGDAAEIMRQMVTEMDQMIHKVLLTLLPDTVARLTEAARDAAAIVAPSFFAPVAIVTERLRIPQVTAVLQPLMMFSAYDAPLSPDLWMFAPGQRRALALAWNKAIRPLVFAEMRRRYAPKVNRLRRELGLPPTDHAPVFGIPKTAVLALGLYSPHIAPPRPDMHPKTLITGFTFFDSASGEAETLDAEAETFLAADEAPIVFTLGSFAVHAPGSFFTSSNDIARKLRRRAILLTGADLGLPPSSDVLVRNYLPNSLIFPRAAGIVHHGGMGTTAQALRAGKPQLVVPHFGDQFDNASRLKRLGVADLTSPERYVAEGEAKLARLLDDRSVQEEATALARLIRTENGAATAADAIAKAIT